MKRLSDNVIDIINELHTKGPHYFNEYNSLIEAANLLAEYENTGLTPKDIEQMKARMPLHQWAGESPDKMSIFSIPVKMLMELTEIKKQGRLIILPCKIGDTVYRVCKKKYDVDGYGMQWEEDWVIITNTFHLGMLHEIGKNVFLTREEAEEVLRGKL
jgi:hypothetical protein